MPVLDDMLILKHELDDVADRNAVAVYSKKASLLDMSLTTYIYKYLTLFETCMMLTRHVYNITTHVHCSYILCGSESWTTKLIVHVLIANWFLASRI